MHQFENETPKAFTNFSPGLEEREPWDHKFILVLTLKGFANRGTLSGFAINILFPGLSLALRRWADTSERLRRYFGSISN